MEIGDWVVVVNSDEVKLVGLVGRISAVVVTTLPAWSNLVGCDYEVEFLDGVAAYPMKEEELQLASPPTGYYEAKQSAFDDLLDAVEALLDTGLDLDDLRTAYDTVKKIQREEESYG